MILMLEAAGYLVPTHTHGNWGVTSPNPKGKKTTCNRDIGVCNRMSYIDLRDNQEGITMIEIFYNKFAGATRREKENAYLVHTV